MNGSVMLRILLTVLSALTCGQLLNGKSPALALLISLAAVLVLLGLLLPHLQAAYQQFSGLLTGIGLDTALLLPVAKVLAITQITHITAELCRDAGERGLAAKLELCGATASLLCILPLAEQALKLIGALGS